MHGDKTQRQRERALARFESGRVDTLVATDVAARGIDVDGISHVINFDPPEDREGYVHRIGRTGRAGSPGVGITFVAPDERRDVGKIAGGLGLAHGLGPASHGQRSKARTGRPRPAPRPQAGRRSRGSSPRSGAPRRTSR